MTPMLRDGLRILWGALAVGALLGGIGWVAMEYGGPNALANTEGGSSDANRDEGEDGQRLRAGTVGVQERLRREQQ